MPAAFRYIALVVLVLGIIGLLTWVTQSLPNTKVPNVIPDGQKGDNVKPVLFFTRVPGPFGDVLTAVWDKDPAYILETERNVEGHYYFPFRNVLGAEAEMEMESADCDCTQADIGLLPAPEWAKVEKAWLEKPWVKPFTDEPTWIKLKKNEHTGIKVPADAHGLLRITWKGRKGIGETLKLTLRFWSQPLGVEGRQFTTVHVPVRMAPAVMYDPPAVTVGVIGPGQSVTAEFYLWSASRDTIDASLQVDSGPSPLINITTRTLSKEECAALQKHIEVKSKGQLLTRARCGLHVTVNLFEQKDGRQMDLGPFVRKLQIMLDQVPVEITPLSVMGTVKGEVTVGGETDQGRVQFNQFSAASPKTVVVPLFADPAVKLEVDPKLIFPRYLQVDLKRNVKSSTPQRTQWDLRTTVPAAALSGPFPENSAIVLRIAGTPPRLVRIPVVGNGTR
jgi:hypothetical protein